MRRWTTDNIGPVISTLVRSRSMDRLRFLIPDEETNDSVESTSNSCPP